MIPEDLAGKSFKVYGLGFNGNDTKYFVLKRLRWLHDDTGEFDELICVGINGLSIKNKIRFWGNFEVKKKGNTEIELDYRFDSSWWVRRLVDKVVDAGWDSLSKEFRNEVLHDPQIDSHGLVLKGVARWWKIRLGRFWMVEVME